MTLPPIRARDLRTNIKEYGFDRGVVMTLELFMDEFAEMRQHMRELADLQSTCMDTMSQFIQISEAMKQRLEALRRTQDDEARGQGIIPDDDSR
jgi:cell division protein ZapA (FtsZ GTPase activity inhibitor)